MVSTITKYHIAQNFGGQKHWRIGVQKDIGGKNIGGLVALINNVKH